MSVITYFSRSEIAGSSFNSKEFLQHIVELTNKYSYSNNILIAINHIILNTAAFNYTDDFQILIPHLKGIIENQDGHYNSNAIRFAIGAMTNLIHSEKIQQIALESNIFLHVISQMSNFMEDQEFVSEGLTFLYNFACDTTLQGKCCAQLRLCNIKQFLCNIREKHSENGKIRHEIQLIRGPLYISKH